MRYRRIEGELEKSAKSNVLKMTKEREREGAIER